MTDNEYCANVTEQYKGSVVTDVVYDRENDTLGLMIEKDGDKTVLWVLRDPEGNGGGFLEAQSV